MQNAGTALMAVGEARGEGPRRGRRPRSHYQSAARRVDRRRHGACCSTFPVARILTLAEVTEAAETDPGRVDS